MERHTDVSFGSKEWEITHRYEEDLIEKMCYFDRLENMNGFSKDHSHRTIARIPRHRLFSDIELILWQKYRGTDDAEADKQLKRWLAKNPKFKTCTGGI